MSDACRRCDGAGWVCESHPFKPWSPAGCMCDAGVPCRCNEDPQRGGFDRVITRVVNPRRSAMITLALVLICIAAIAMLMFGGDA